MMNTLSLWSGSALLAISTVAMAQDAVPPSSPSPDSETAPTQPQAATSTAETAQVNDVNDDDGIAEVDRKSDVEGKSVSVRVDLGGCRTIKKKTTTSCNTHKKK